MKTIIKFKTARTIILSAIMLMFGSLFVQAGSLIKGKITDKNNNPIPYATAILTNPVTMEIIQGDMTDESGRFIIENIKPGKYILSLRSVGYQTLESCILEIGDNEIITTAKVSLKEKISELGEIVVMPESDINGLISVIN